MHDPNSLQTVNLKSASVELNLKVPNDESTQYVLDEIFKGRCYAPVPGIPAPKAILDIGANVGLAAAFFRLTYPDALIHCVEPDPFGFRVLQDNAQVIGRCAVHNVGLLDSDRTMAFNSAPRPVLSSLTANPIVGSASIEISCRSAGPFAQSLGVDVFDLIKIDTEGAEVPILRSLGDIIGKATVVHLEFHSHAGRRQIDDLMLPTHYLWAGAIEAPHRGHLTYVAIATAEALIKNSFAQPLVVTS